MTPGTLNVSSVPSGGKKRLSSVVAVIPGWGVPSSFSAGAVLWSVHVLGTAMAIVPVSSTRTGQSAGISPVGGGKAPPAAVAAVVGAAAAVASSRGADGGRHVERVENALQDRLLGGSGDLDPQQGGEHLVRRVGGDHMELDMPVSPHPL